MNLGISINVYLAKSGNLNKAISELKKALKITSRTMFTYRTTERAAQGRLPEIAEFFNVSVSDFIKAGEDDKKT